MEPSGSVVVVLVVVVLVLAVINPLFASYYDGHALEKVTALSITIFAGAAVFGGAVLVLKAYDATLITKLLKRKR